MTPLNPIENLFAVEVPDDAKDFGCVHVYHGEDVLYYPDEKGETQPFANAPCHCDLVEFLFTTSTATEQQANELLGPEPPHYSMFPDFEGENSQYATAINSLASLLRANNLDPNKNYLLIKRNEQ